MYLKIDRTIYDKGLAVMLMVFSATAFSCSFGLPSSAQSKDQSYSYSHGNTGEIVTGSNGNKESEKIDAQKSQALSHYWLANNYLWHWNIKLASTELQVAIMYYPDLQAAHRDLCLAYLFGGYPLKALAELMMVVGLGSPIALNSAEQTELTERAEKEHYRLGLKYGRDRYWLEAITEFQWALSYSPNDVAVDRSLAFAYANIGNFEKAEEFYQTTFSANPKDAFSHADFAFMLVDTGHRERARQELSKAVQLEPSAAALHVDLGWMAESGGNYAIAEQEFHQAVKLSPKHGGLWVHYGRILEHLGRKVEAIAAYNQALQIDPGQGEAKRALLKLNDNGAS